MLAKAAGFWENDALKIAYASQYVDDSTEGGYLKVKKQLFEPTRTSYFGLRATKWAINKKIYIPFHFLPPKPKSMLKKSFSFVTKPNSEFGNLILDKAIAEKNYKFRLIRVGVALHTFADTWAHQNFSGRHDEENNINEIYINKDGNWDSVGVFDTAPNVGHAEASHNPDLPYLNWKYKTNKGKFIERDDTKLFLEASEVIYNKLKEVKKEKVRELISFSKIKPAIKELFKYKNKDTEERCKEWRKSIEFNSKKYKYKKERWRIEALQPKKRQDIKWDNLSEEEQEGMKFKNPKNNFENSNFVMFHRAALMQRNFVLENIM